MNFDIEAIQNLGLTQAVSTEPRSELGQGDFLKLLVTQMTNQDPFKPLESGDFLGQIAQFGTVSGIQDLQKSFSEFASSISSDQALQGANLVGRTVLVPGNTGLLGAGGEITGELSVPSDASAVVVSVFDLNGELLRTLELGAQQAGQVPFNWDGQLDDGTFADPAVYLIQGSAIVAGENQALATQIRANVESVTTGGGNGGLLLNLVGLGSVGFNEVLGIL